MGYSVSQKMADLQERIHRGCMMETGMQNAFILRGDEVFIEWDSRHGDLQYLDATVIRVRDGQVLGGLTAYDSGGMAGEMVRDVKDLLVRHQLI